MQVVGLGKCKKALSLSPAGKKMKSILLFLLIGWSCAPSSVIITQPPFDATFMVPNDTLTLNCTAMNPPGAPLPLQFYWVRDSTVLVEDARTVVWSSPEDNSTSATSVLTITNITRQDRGLYLCVVTNRGPEYRIESDSATVSLLFAPVVISISLDDGNNGFVAMVNGSFPVPVDRNDIDAVAVFDAEPIPFLLELTRINDSDRILVSKSSYSGPQLYFRATLPVLSLADSGVTFEFAAVNTLGRGFQNFTILVQALFFQLKLTGVLNCESWRSMDIVSKDMDIVKAIVKSIAAMCDCDFTADRLTDRVFLCLPSSPQSITYQAQLHGTLQTPVEDLGIKIQEWALSGVSIPVQLVPLKLEGACVSSTASTLECEPTESTQMENKNKVQFGTIIAAVIPVVVVFVLIIIALAIIITVRIRHSKMKPKTEPERVGAIALSYVGTLTDDDTVG